MRRTAVFAMLGTLGIVIEWLSRVAAVFITTVVLVVVTISILPSWNNISTVRRANPYPADVAIRIEEAEAKQKAAEQELAYYRNALSVEQRIEEERVRAALEQARRKLAAEEEARRQGEAKRRTAEEEAKRKAAAEGEAKRAEEEARRKAEEEARAAAVAKAEEEARRLAEAKAKAGAFKRNGDTTEVSKIVPEKPASIGANTLSSSNPCSTTEPVCTIVPIFFGTDRRQQDLAERISFGPERSGALSLGRALVSVPRAVERKRGEITRPTWWERNVLRVPAEGEPAKHFTILKGGTTLFRDADELLAAVRVHMADAGPFKEHAFVFVHGFNTTFDGALYRTAQIAYDLGDNGKPFGTAFLYTWPSVGQLEYYGYDFDSARFAVGHLKEFLNLVIQRSGAEHVHIIAHSMGNWPMLSAIDQIAKATKGRTLINQMVLAAPDIDVGEFLKMADAVQAVAKGVTLYASSTDIAMVASRKVHYGVPRAGDVPPEGPVIVKDIDTIDVSFLTTDSLAINHNHYADKRELLNDIGLLLRRGIRPPHERAPIYERVPHKASMYWRYPN